MFVFGFVVGGSLRSRTHLGGGGGCEDMATVAVLPSFCAFPVLLMSIQDVVTPQCCGGGSGTPPALAPRLVHVPSAFRNGL